MLHTTEDYPQPDEFRPERFIGKDCQIDPTVRDPTTIVFGFGRRACPGSDFARATLTIGAASLFHVFRIEAGVDDSGAPVELFYEGGNSAIRFR